jgi:hypothetical protein
LKRPSKGGQAGFLLRLVADNLNNQSRAFASTDGDNAIPIDPGTDIRRARKARHDVFNDVFANSRHD